MQRKTTLSTTLKTVERPNVHTKSLAWRPSRLYTSTALAIAGLTISLIRPAQATTVFATLSGSLVTNGGFEQLSTGTTPSQLNAPSRPPLCGNPAICGANPGFSAGALLTGWSASGFTFVFGSPVSGSPSNTNADFGAGAPNQFTPVDGTNFFLWGPGNGSANNLGPSPNGGNFVGLDGDTTNFFNLQGVISQQIAGLTPNLETTVSFYWAGAQQEGFTGENFEQLQVNLCAPGQTPGPSSPFQIPGLNGCSAYTDVLDNPNHGFTGWRPVSFTFIPTSATETLSFFAIGAPGSMPPAGGEPPFVLLDGVSVQPVPEPGTWSLLGIGLAAIGGRAYLRRKSVPDKAITHSLR